MSTMDPRTIQCLSRSWKHSHEEDSGGLSIYRPADYNFPLSRRRHGMEIRPDGGLVHTGPGPDDRMVSNSGSWTSDGDSLVTTAGSEKPRRMTVVHSDDQVLKVKWE